MMKKGVIYEVVLCKEMAYQEAKSYADKVRVIADNPKDDDTGILVCHSDSLHFEWVDEKVITLTPFDKFTDIIRFYSTLLTDFSKYLKEKCKDHVLTDEQRREIYTINRHLKFLQTSCNKLI